MPLALTLAMRVKISSLSWIPCMRVIISPLTYDYMYVTISPVSRTRHKSHITWVLGQLYVTILTLARVQATEQKHITHMIGPAMGHNPVLKQGPFR